MKLQQQVVGGPVRASVFAGVLAISAGNARAQNEALLIGDASARVSLAQAAETEAASSGRDAKGFFIRGGGARLGIGGFMQFRYTANQQDAAPGSEDFTHGFQSRKTRVTPSGNLSKEISFRIDMDFTNGTGAVFDAWMGYKVSDEWTLRAGQFKGPLLMEDLVLDTRQLTVERSTVTNVFGQSRMQGVEAAYVGENVRALFMLSDGLRTLNTGITSAAEADYGITGRVDYKWAGDWKSFESHTGWTNGAYEGVAGAALHWQSGGETSGTSDVDQFEFTIDTMAKGAGWNVAAAFVGNSTDTTTGEFLDLGWLVQGGIFATEQLEFFARYSQIEPDDDRVNGDSFPEVTIGSNYYILPNSHAAKLTTDVTLTLGDQAGSSSIVGPSAANGLLASTDSSQLYLRMQFQLVF